VNVLLVVPPVSGETAYPLGIAQVAAALRRAGHRVAGCDLSFTGDDLQGLLAALRPGLVGLTTRCDTLAAVPPLAAAVGAAARAADIPPPTLVLGGPGVTLADPSTVPDLTAVGFRCLAVVGDGETAAVELAAALEARDSTLPAGVVDLADPPRDWPAPRCEADLTTLPTADYELFPLRRYNRRGTLSQRYPYAPLVTSRGCERQCPFCAAPRLGQGRWRPRHPAAVVADMERLHRRLGVAGVHIEDDDFLHDPARVEEIALRLRRAPTAPVWELMNGARPDHLTPRVIRALARGGCVSVTLGIEGLNPTAARLLPGSLDEGDLRALVLELHRAGLTVGGYFMFGLPGETPADARRTLESALRLGLDLARFSLFRPVPGSRWADAPEPSAKAAGALARLRREAYLRFYLRPRAMLAVGRRLDHRTLGPALQRVAGVLGGGPT